MNFCGNSYQKNCKFVHQQFQLVISVKYFNQESRSLLTVIGLFWHNIDFLQTLQAKEHRKILRRHS